MPRNIYQKGNPGGPGRPKKVVEEARLSLLKEIFNEDEERAVILNVMRIAKLKGKTTNQVAINASTWLWDRVYGKPKEYLELDANVDVKGYTEVSPDDWDSTTQAEGNSDL